MKRICFLGFLPLMLLFASCEKNDVGPYYSYIYKEHFIDIYYTGGIELMHYGSEGSCTALRIGATDMDKFIIEANNPLEYEQQAELHGDYFNRWVYEYRGWCIKIFAEQFQSLHVVSDADWDEEHPAGTLLDDLLRVEFTSIGAFVRGGYHAGGTDESEWMHDWQYFTRVDKPVSELTPSDMDMMECEYVLLYFMRAPTLEREHTLTVILTTTEGKVYTDSLYCIPEVESED